MNAHLIKEIRKSKGLVLKEIANATGYTESYLSQIERGLKNPSLEALRKISNVLGVPIITFLFEEGSQLQPCENRYQVIRESSRKKINIPNLSNSSEFFTPALTDGNSGQKFHGLFIRLDQNESASEKLISHGADESVLVLNGIITVFLEDEIVQLEKGDSIYIFGGMSHNYTNKASETAELIVFMSSEN